MLRRPSGLLLSRACARPSALLGCASHHGARCLHAPHTAARISPAARAAAAARSAHSSVQPLTLVDRARGAYAAYDGLLQSHRLLTTTATGAVLAFLGDACTQAATEANIMHDGYDISRGVSFALFGATVTGPVNYYWLSLLDRIVRTAAPQGGPLGVCCKVAVQTFFFQPCCYVPLFFAFSALFRGWTAEVAVARVKAEYPRTVRSLWGFWTPICVFTFAVLPVRQQAIFFSAVSLCWNAILSFLANRPQLAATANTKLAEEQVVESLAEADVPLLSASRRRLSRTISGGGGRLIELPDHLPPMGILDNDPNPPPKMPPSAQSIIGFLLGPGLM